MDSGLVIQIVTIIILLMLSAFFSSAETSLTCVNLVRIHTLAEGGDKRAARVEKILSNPGKMLSTILIGNNIVNISASSLVTTFTIKVFGNYAVGIATGVLTVLVLMFGEILPKTAANLCAEKLALAYSFFILKLIWLLTPIVFLVDKLSQFLMKLLGIDTSKTGSGMTETELKTYVDVSHEDGVIESDEKEMIYNVFDLGDAIAKDVMVPRVNVTFADIDSSYDELIDLFREDKFTRLPVYQETKDNVVGTINMKDLLLYDSKKSEFQIKDILREAYFTYEYKSISELLVEMRQASFNIAIVLDEYGETSGLITLEDILEEIVGEIHDEYDENEEENIKAVGKHEYIIEGSTNLDDLNDSLDLNLESEDYDSLGGFIIEKLDRLPKAGDSVSTEDGIRMVVEKLDKNRIETVHLYLPENYREHTSDSLETDD